MGNRRMMIKIRSSLNLKTWATSYACNVAEQVQALCREERLGGAMGAQTGSMCGLITFLWQSCFDINTRTKKKFVPLGS